MHELSIAEAVVAQAERAARDHGGGQVRLIRLSVGALSGVEPPLLARAFTIARAGTLAREAELQIETPPIRVRCPECGAETEAQVNRLICGQCGNWRVTLTSGEELLLLSLELDLPADAPAPKEASHV